MGLGRTAVALGLGGGTRRGDEGVLGGVGCGDSICCRRAARADEEQDGSDEERSRPAPQHRGPPRSVISTAINSPINPLLYLTCEIFRAAPAARGGTRDEIAEAHAARPVTPPRSGTQPAGPDEATLDRRRCRLASQSWPPDAERQRVADSFSAGTTRPARARRGNDRNAGHRSGWQP